MRIWKTGGFVDSDEFEPLEECGTVTSTAIVPLGRFLTLGGSEKAAVCAVRLQPGDDVSVLAPWLDQLALVAVTFPAFNDGRAFSQATLLRERYGYAGDIRALGDILIDQVAHMLRCGIDSVAVTNPVAVARLEAGRLGGVSQHYQPAARGGANPGGYSWRRLSPSA